MLAVIPIGVAQSKFPPAASRKVDYKKDIQPLLAQNCYSCHGPEVQQAGLRLDLRQNALRGGDYGPVIKIGDSAASKLIHRLVDGDGGLQMPPNGALSNEEIGLLRAWIDQGAEFRTDIVAEAPRKPVDPKVAELIAAVRAGGAPPARQPNQPPPCGAMRGPARILAGGLPMPQFASMLTLAMADDSGPAGRDDARVVIDKTGLSGRFAFTLTWTPQRIPEGTPPPGIPPVDPNGPALVTALQEQLGLKLQPARSRMEVVVIDSVEQPTPD